MTNNLNQESLTTAQIYALINGWQPESPLDQTRFEAECEAGHWLIHPDEKGNPAGALHYQIIELPDAPLAFFVDQLRMAEDIHGEHYLSVRDSLLAQLNVGNTYPVVMRLEEYIPFQRGLYSYRNALIGDGEEAGPLAALTPSNESHILHYLLYVQPLPLLLLNNGKLDGLMELEDVITKYHPLQTQLESISILIKPGDAQTTYYTEVLTAALAILQSQTV